MKKARRRSAVRRGAAAPRSTNLRRRAAAAPVVAFRIGHGYDVHRLEAGDGVVLGGVRIECEYRLVAHSDGDVLIHALCDALLGAAGLADIGHWFPDSDARYRGADSRTLLREVVAKLRRANWRVANADLTLIAEAPKVARHVAAMRKQLAADLNVELHAIGIKATTNEGIGFLGRREGIAAHAVALIQKSR
jgi:2-C-methyl-D-erythritol 2,4-cyclodiphosphate synthase